MSSEEIQELLRKAGVGEDQWKYYTATEEELPGLFGFSPFQTERFGQLFGGLGQFDPTKISEAYGTIKEFGQQKTADIGQQFKTGIGGIGRGLMEGIQGIGENIASKIPGFGARQREVKKERFEAYEGASELGRRKEMGLLNLEEMLGGRRAAVGRTAQSWQDKLMNLVSSIYQMDPRETDPTRKGVRSGFAQETTAPVGLDFPTDLEARYSRSQLTSYFQQKGITISQEDLENYINLYSQAYKSSGNTLSVEDWWKSQQSGG